MTGLVFKQMNEGIRGEGLCPRPHSLEQSPGSPNSELTLTSQHTCGSGSCTSSSQQPGSWGRSLGRREKACWAVWGPSGWAGKRVGVGGPGGGWPWGPAPGHTATPRLAALSASCLSSHRLSFAASSSRPQGLAFLRASAHILPCSLSGSRCDLLPRAGTAGPPPHL